MSASETPKKYYFKQGKQTASSSCRLCMKICDPKNAKNIFNRGNVELLATAEDLLEQTLERGENLPHLVCRPCERRLANFKQFKEMAKNTQRTIKADSRAKRCKEMSPTIPPPSKKTETAPGTSRRVLQFLPSEMGSDIEVGSDVEVGYSNNVVHYYENNTEKNHFINLSGTVYWLRFIKNYNTV